MKRLKAAQRIEREQRLALWNLMYGQDAAEERKLDQREAEVDAREQQARLKILQADIEKSINDAEVDQKDTSKNR